MPLVDFEGINRAALRNGRSFLKDFIPGGTFRSLDYVVRNPTRDDKHPGSFKINYKTGIWKDFASGHGGGDLISLVAYVRGISQGEAVRELANKLGVPLHKQNGVTSSKPNDGDGRCIITPTVELRAYGTGRADCEVVVPIPADAPAKPREHFELGKSTATWPYRDATGGELGYVYRFDPPGNKKEFRPLTLRRVNDKLEWRWEGWPPKRPLYGLHKLAERPSARVLVAEGEKSADAAQGLLPDYVTVTSPNGSNAADKADWSQLRDREVVIWPDADAAGEKYGKDVTDCLIAIGVNSVVTIAPPAGVKEGWDAADALDEGWTTERVAELIATVRPSDDNPEKRTPAVIPIGNADDEIRRLASLSIVKYEREREGAAKSLGMRASALDDAVKRARRPTEDTKGQGHAFELQAIEPWPSAVEGAELLSEVTEAIKRYVVLPANSAEAVALWAMHTHCFDCFGHSPRAAMTSPEKGCGKTTTLDVLECLVSRPLSTANATVSAIFRIVEQAAPTLLIDEATSRR